MRAAEEKQALAGFRAGLLAFADEPSIVNLKRYLDASRRLDAVRAASGLQRRQAA